MSDIQQQLAELETNRITPAVLGALDWVVPGEWQNDTSLESVIVHQLGVDDPDQIEAIRARAIELYAAEPHYARAASIFKAVDTVDQVAAAAVLAKKAGEGFEVLSILDRFTPKVETTQAIDAALKLTAEIAAFASLRGIPVTSLTEAKAFPATLATYAKADMMRLAAWIALDGLLPLGPEFVGKIRQTVRESDTSAFTNNALFQKVSGLLPGEDADGQKGFVLTSLDSASAWLEAFVEARGLTQEDLQSKLGTVVNVADAGADILAATVDATTNYFEHTGIQSVARVLVHDAAASLAQGEGTPTTVAEGEETQDGGRWFKTAAAVAAGGAAGVAVGSMLVKDRAEEADAEAEAPPALPSESEVAATVVAAVPDDLLDDDGPDPETEALDDDVLAAREAALDMKERQLNRQARKLDRQTVRMVQRERRKLRRERQRRRKNR